MITSIDSVKRETKETFALINRVGGFFVHATLFLSAFLFGFYFLKTIFFLVNNSLLKIAFLASIGIAYIFHIIVKKKNTEFLKDVKGLRLFYFEIVFFLAAVCFVGFSYSFLIGLLRNFFPELPIFFFSFETDFLDKATPIFIGSIVFLVDWIILAAVSRFFSYFEDKFTKKMPWHYSESILSMMVYGFFGFIIGLILLLILFIIFKFITPILFNKLSNFSFFREFVASLFGIPALGYYRFLYGKTRFFKGNKA